MSAALGILLLLIALIVHEAGHALAMMRRGIEIQEAGIGLPITGKLKLTFRSRFLPFPIVLTPALLGAYVRPTKKGTERLESMSYRDQAVCSGAGVVMNVVFGGALLCIVASISVHSSANNQARLLVVSLIAGGVAAAAAIFRRAFSRVMPVFGVAGLLLLIFSLIDSTENVGGPLTVVSTAASGKSLVDALKMGFVMSISLAYLNVLPLFPLDGGKIVSAFFETRGWKQTNLIFSATTGVVFLGFIGFVVVKDFL